MTEEELIELLVAFVPESLFGWAGAVMTVSAFLSVILPAPSEDSHPAIKICHRAIAILGLGAGRLRGLGKLGKLAKIGGLIKRK